MKMCEPPVVSASAGSASLPPVLDACCGSRMFWFDKNDPRALFLDKRDGVFVTDERKGRAATIIRPDIVGDFKNLPFPDASFYLVIFDPPHLLEISAQCRLGVKYGKLFSDWRDELGAGFAECFRVLKANGVLVFKWSEAHIPIPDVLALSKHPPLFGNKAIGISNRVPRGSTHWIAFLKPNMQDERRLCSTHPDVNYNTAWGCPECVREMRLLLTSAAHALRSYQYGNASQELAESVANRIETALSLNSRIERPK